MLRHFLQQVRQVISSQSSSSPNPPLVDKSAQPTESPAVKRQRRWNRLGYGLIGLWAMTGAIATGINLGTVLWMERQAQVLFFRLRGTVEPPPDIVILAMDQDSLARGEDYQIDPDRYPEMEPIAVWPWQRSAYAEVIDRLMAAGAKAVAIDVLLTDPSLYGMEDDQRLRQSLEQYSTQVVLAASYEAFGTPEAGEQGQIILPNPEFQVNPQAIGLINFLPDPDTRVYQLADDFVVQVLRSQGLGEDLSSFALTTLRASGVTRSEVQGGGIYFYGPPTTFERVPFWHILDPDNWTVHQQNQTFQDKIVLIGPIADSFQDFVPTPFSEGMPGVELHANAIATLLEDRVIYQAVPNPQTRGILILLSVAGVGVLITRSLKRPVRQFLLALGIALGWGVISYLSFTHARIILPTTVPILAIALTGLTRLTTGSISNQLEQRRLRLTLERYVAAPIVQQILTNSSEDYQDLLKGRRVKAAVLFCDIRSFTTLSLELPPEQLVEQLNVYLNAMVEAILEAGGTVDKFIGDAIMAEFGSPISQGEKVDAMNAIRAALGMRRALLKLQDYWKEQGQTIFFNGVGINFGEAIAGDIGSYRRREYALIGDAVNVASRVEGMTRNFWTDILITHSLYELVQDQVDVVSVGTHPLKGRGANTVMLYSLVGIKGEDQQDYHVIHEKLRAVHNAPKLEKKEA